MATTKSAQRQRSVQKSASGKNKKPVVNKKESLSAAKLKDIHNYMCQARALEERIIKMGKSGEGYFWIGGPGEEAFNIPLGMQVNKGKGIEHDYLHLHYRSSGILTAMGAPMIDTIRQMKSVATDPYSGGRNFVNHYCVPDWNIVPVSSCIEPQYLQAIGTAHAQTKRKDCKGVTIVNGGDAGTAEGDFASCLVWASRPANPLPILIIVTNNGYGISTSYEGQHGEACIADRARAFGIEAKVINGNDVWESWEELEKGFQYVRENRRPYFIEANVSRMYGHSSASGANRNMDLDPLEKFEEQLVKQKVYTQSEIAEIRETWTKVASDNLKQVREEAEPDPASIYDHVFAEENEDKGRDDLAATIGLDFTKDKGSR